jgi:hypothetical protein
MARGRLEPVAVELPDHRSRLCVLRIDDPLDHEVSGVLPGEVAEPLKRWLKLIGCQEHALKVGRRGVLAAAATAR